MNPDWTMVALSLLALALLYLPRVRCHVLGGHPGAVRPMWFIDGHRWLGWDRCSACGQINPDVVP